MRAILLEQRTDFVEGRLGEKAARLLRSAQAARLH
jgi:hypothetical protein